MRIDVLICKAFKKGLDFVVSLEQQQSPPTKSAASHTGEDPSCLFLQNVWILILGVGECWTNHHHVLY